MELNLLDVVFLVIYVCTMSIQGFLVSWQMDKSRRLIMVKIPPIAEGVSQWSDAPLKSSVGDQFGRISYARSIARTISENHSSEESVVFGIVGPWGSGKSSMLVMVEESLKAIERDCRMIVHFNPWVTSDIDGLLSEFYTALFSEVLSDDPQKWKKIVIPLLRITSSSFKQFNYLGAPVAAAIDIGAEHISKPVPWNEAFEKAAEEIRCKGKKILVVADDIDRLQGDELRAFLKVIRLLGRFPGVQYLLAYDQESVADTLQQDRVASDRTSTLKFMEKIVQYPFNVPSLTDRQILERIFTGIENSLEYSGRSLAGARVIEGSCRWGAKVDLGKVLVSKMQTPRSINRFLYQLKPLFSTVPEEEICDADLIILTLLSIHYPKLHQELPRWCEVLCEGKGASNEDWRGEFLSNLLTVVEEDQREDARKILVWLFPVLWEPPRVVVTVAGNDYEKRDQSEERRIADKNYFYRYFILGVPEYEVSDAKVRAVLHSVSSEEGEKDLENLLFPDGPGKEIDEHVFSRIKGFLPELQSPSSGGERLDAVLFCKLLSFMTKMPEWETAGGDKRQLRYLLQEILMSLGPGVEWRNILTILPEREFLGEAVAIVSGVQCGPQDSDKIPEWWDGFIDIFCGNVADHVSSYFFGEEDLSQMDSMERAVWLLQRNNKGGIVRERIEERRRSSGTFNAVKYAALFVEVKMSLAVDKKVIIGFDSDVFKEFCPSSFTEPLCGDDPSCEEIDKSDVTWENRMKFAKKELKST